MRAPVLKLRRWYARRARPFRKAVEPQGRLTEATRRKLLLTSIQNTTPHRRLTP